jgi:hypothetical protein
MPRQRKYQTNGERQAAYRCRCAQAGKITQASEPIPSAPGRRRWKAVLKAASNLLDCAVSEMQDYFDQHSEAWQDSQAGECLAEMLESVQEALATLDDATHHNRQAKPAVT